jgi:hypothetical protein
MEVPVDQFDLWFEELSDASTISARDKKEYERLITVDHKGKFFELVRRCQRKGIHLGLPI